MIINMERKKFDLFSDADLGAACFEPLILTYKREMSKENHAAVSEQFYSRLSSGQKALFTFYIYYNHACKSLVELYWWSTYFRAQPKTWSAIKGGLEYFEDEALLNILEEIDLVLERHHYPTDLKEFNVKREELDDNKDLLHCMELLNARFNKTVPFSIRKISEYIRSNRAEFVHFVD
ncbi:hypothetical protein ABET51_10510 [Metabacillus fastidiosus]|uniref:hypothetical protein n=1 Tax=Metabacillus fastidiosus TaxID=1458 RepID=UPI002E1CE28F|nr:hypothetical protein [Metabacillus fastidiosus]